MEGLGGKLALVTLATLMNGVQTLADTEPTPTTRGRTGVAIGILIVTLLAIAFYFYWRTTAAG